MSEKLKILLIDDESCWLEVLSDILKRWGFRVTAVGSASEAIRVFSEEKFELVITDFDMPGMNGVELTKNLRNLSTAIPVILMSGDEMIRTSYYAKQAGITAYIDKSNSLDRIRKCIESVVRRPITSST